MDRRTGMTLVELLVASAVIAVLVALSLPAIQSARESARQTQCRNGLKQIGIAAQNYHDVYSSLPPGAIGRFSSVKKTFQVLFKEAGYFDPRFSSQETPWLFQLLPYLDQTAVFSKFDFDHGTFGYVDLSPPLLITGLNRNADVMKSDFTFMLCPSDVNRPFDYDVGGLLTGAYDVTLLRCMRGNYAANWGNTNWEQDGDLDGDGNPDPGVKFLGAPFGRCKVTQLRDISDGIDQTALFGEVRQGGKVDGRGAVVTSLPGGSIYMSRFTPNGVRDIFLKVPEQGEGGGDQMPFFGVCSSEPELPCSYEPVEYTAFAGSRSYHTDGVNVATASGSVRFVNNSIDAAVWEAFHSSAGKENVSVE